MIDLVWLFQKISAIYSKWYYLLALNYAVKSVIKNVTTVIFILYQ